MSKTINVEAELSAISNLLDGEESVRQGLLTALEPKLFAYGPTLEIFRAVQRLGKVYKSAEMLDVPGLTEEAKVTLKKAARPKVSDPTLILGTLNRFARYRFLHKQLKDTVAELSRSDGDINLGLVRRRLASAISATTEAPTRAIETIKAEDIAPAPLTFLWRKFIPRACLTALDGDGGVGKSALTCFIIAEVAARGGRTLLINLEDDLETVLSHRLVEADIADDMCRVFTKVSGEGGAALSFPDDIKTLEHYIVQNEIDLVVLDPLFEFLLGIDSNTNQVREVLQPLRDIAKRTRAAILLTRHVSKGSKSKGPDNHSGLGSVAISGCVRSVMVAHRFNDDLVELKHVKYNNSEKQPSLFYHVERGDVLGGAVVKLDEPPFGGGEPEGAPKPKRNTAIAFLLKHGGADASHTSALKAEAAKLGISSTTLDRARRALRAKKEE